MDISGRIALVTGCGRGIGRAIARCLAESGVDLVLFDLEQEPLEKIAEEVQGKGRRNLLYRGDASVEDDVDGVVQQAIKTFDHIDILVNVAGITGPTAEVESISLPVWEKTISVNLTSVFLFCKKVIPHMKEQRSGSIINISSLAGTKGKAFRSPYSASKWALIGLSKSVANEVGPYNIRVNTICPGRVEGERMDKVRQLEAEVEGMSIEEVRAREIKSTPLRRTLLAEEIASVARFLASDEASAITGQEIIVSCGKS